MTSQDKLVASTDHLAPTSSAQSPAEVIMNEVVYVYNETSSYRVLSTSPHPALNSLSTKNRALSKFIKDGGP